MVKLNINFKTDCHNVKKLTIQTKIKLNLFRRFKHLLFGCYDCFIYLFRKIRSGEKCSSGTYEIVAFLWMAIQLKIIWNRY
jgi:hypothetical protein